MPLYLSSCSWLSFTNKEQHETLEVCVSVHLLNGKSHGESNQVWDLLSRNGPVSFLEGYKLWSLQHRQAISMYTWGNRWEKREGWKEDMHRIKIPGDLGKWSAECLSNMGFRTLMKWVHGSNTNTVTELLINTKRKPKQIIPRSKQTFFLSFFKLVWHYRSVYMLPMRHNNFL